MRPSEALARHRDEVIAILARYPVSNPRIFGSVARGEDHEGSEIDILVDVPLDDSYFALAGLSAELKAVLGCVVDIGEADALRHSAGETLLTDVRTL